MDLIKEIWQTMCTNKLRTILTGISVAWGIFMLILLLSVANGVVNRSEQFQNAGDPNRISIWSGYTSKPYMGMKEGRYIPLRVKNFEAIKQGSPDQVSSVDGSINYSGQISTSKDYITSSTSGVYPSYFTGRYKLKTGRFINDADIQGQRKVIVLHKNSAKALFDNPEKSVGQTIKLNNLVFTVIGLYDHDWSESSYIPFTTARALGGYADDLNSIEVHIKNVTNEKESAELEKEVRHSMSKVELFDPTDNSAVYTYDRFASQIESQRANNILKGAMWVIGALTLITGIVGVSNIMFVSVRERTHEIGIRRAIGAKPRHLLTQVVLESVALTTCFGYIGIVMGTFATEIVKYAFRDKDFMVNPSVDLSIALEVTLALIIAGALAGLFPALRAIKVKPVEALRDE